MPDCELPRKTSTTRISRLLREKLEAAEKLLEIANRLNLSKKQLINAKDSRGYPLIYDLLFEGCFESAIFLIRHGANLGLTAGEHAIIIELLSHKKDAAARILTNVDLSSNIDDKELIKWILLDNRNLAKARAQALIGDSSQFIQDEISDNEALITKEYSIPTLKTLYTAALTEGNLKAAQLIDGAKLPLKRFA